MTLTGIFEVKIPGVVDEYIVDVGAEYEYQIGPGVTGWVVQLPVKVMDCCHEDRREISRLLHDHAVEQDVVGQIIDEIESRKQEPHSRCGHEPFDELGEGR